MLSADQLGSMQATLLASLPESCQVGRYSSVSDGGGGLTETWPLDAAIPCRVGPMPPSLRSAELVIGGGEATDLPWTFTFAHDVLIDEKDRILYHGRWFEVTAVQASRSWQVDVRVLCRLVVPS